MNSDSRVSMRALREIHLRGFEIAIQEAQPWTLMLGYNALNGYRCAENKDLLRVFFVKNGDMRALCFLTGGTVLSITSRSLQEMM